MNIGESDNSGRQITETGGKTTGIKFFSLMSQKSALETTDVFTSGADKEKTLPRMLFVNSAASSQRHVVELHGF